MLYWTILIILILLGSSLSECRNTFEFISYTEESIPEYFESIKFKLLNDSRTGTRVLNGSAIFSRDLQQFDLTITATINEKSKGRQFKMLDVTLDVCKLIGGGEPKRSLGLIYNILKNMRSFGHLYPENCPFKKSEEFYLDKFYVSSDIFPSRLPYMMVDISIGLAQKNVIFHKSNIVAVIARKNSKR